MVGESVKNTLPGQIEQQLSVMTEIGVAAKLTDIPGCVIARCDLGYEKNNLLALTNSILQKTEKRMPAHWHSTWSAATSRTA